MSEKKYKILTTEQFDSDLGYKFFREKKVKTIEYII